MSNPSTFKAEPSSGGPAWDDYSSLHKIDDGGGMLSEFKSVRHGTLAELVRFVTTLPEHEQPHYAIDKAGDHRLNIGEILALARRPDFPKA